MAGLVETAARQLKPSILIRMDADQAGQGAAAQIARLSQAARCIQVPQGKDVNEFYLLAGHEAVRRLVEGMVVIGAGQRVITLSDFLDYALKHLELVGNSRLKHHVDGNLYAIDRREVLDMMQRYDVPLV